MSKVFKSFRKHLLQIKVCEKFFKEHKAGQRIAPNNIAKENAEQQLRIDSGEVVNGRKNICLRVNSEAKNTALKEYRNKHGTHSNIAVTSIKTDVPKDQQVEELTKALDAMEPQLRSKIG